MLPHKEFMCGMNCMCGIHATHEIYVGMNFSEKMLPHMEFTRVYVW